MTSVNEKIDGSAAPPDDGSAKAAKTGLLRSLRSLAMT
jgi:hypothetical protein